MTDKRLVEKISLPNGLTVRLYNGSRRVAGDRWLVVFLATVDVAVEARYLTDADMAGVSLEALRQTLGATAAYHHEKRANFVAEEEKDARFDALKKQFLDSNMGYLASPDFPRRLILREYEKAQTRYPC